MHTWITYADNDDYWLGALVLAKNLLSVHSKYPLIVFVPHSYKPNLILPSLGNVIVRQCAPIQHLGKRTTRPEYRSCLNKLHAWSLQGFEKVGWLDCDMLIVKNIDELFEFDLDHDEMLAAPGCTCNVFQNPKLPTEPHECPLSRSGSCLNVYVNTGVFVIRPSSQTYERLLDYDYDHPLPDQDAFNEFFVNRIHLLDSSYNYMVHLSLAHPEIDSKDAKIIHFTYDKPWKKIEGTQMPLCQSWRVLWNECAESVKNLR